MVSVLLVVLVSCALCLLGGCEDLPPLPRADISGEHMSKVVEIEFSSEGRGGYDWNLLQSQFAVSAPAPREIFAAIDMNKVRQQFQSGLAAAQASAWHRPSWMDENTYGWFRRTFEPDPGLKTLVKIPVSVGAKVPCAAIRGDGKILITLDEKLRVWDVDTGQLSKQIDAPIENSLQAMFTPSGEQILVHNGKSLVRLSLDGGQIEATWQPRPATTIAYVAIARTAGVCAVVDSQSQLCVLDQTLQETANYHGPGLAAPVVSIRPDGGLVIGTIDQGWLNWSPSGESSKQQTLLNQQLRLNSTNSAIDPATVIPVAGNDRYRWVSLETAHEIIPIDERRLLAGSLTPDVLFLIGRMTSEPIQLNLALWHAQACSSIDVPDWLAVIGHRAVQGATRKYYVQDLLLGEAQWSTHQLLGERQPVWAAFSDNGERLAVVFQDAIEVYSRVAWHDASGEQLAQRIASLLRVGNIALLESCLRELRAQPASIARVSGEQLFSIAIQRLGSELVSFNGLPADSTVRQTALQWAASESEFGRLVSSAQYLLSSDSWENGRAMPNMVATTSEPMRMYPQRALQNLEQSLSAERPAMEAFRQLILCKQRLGLHCNDSIADIKRYVELYPHEPQTHASIADWLQTDPDHFVGEASAYLEAFSRELPAAERESFYFHTALKCSWTLSDGVPPDHARLVTAAKAELAANRLSAQEIEGLLGRGVSRYSVTDYEDLVHYHLLHFPISTSSSQYNSLFRNITEQIRSRVK